MCWAKGPGGGAQGSPRSPWSPRTTLFQEVKQQKRRVSPSLGPAASPSAAAALGSLDTAPGMVPGQEDVL